MIRVRWSKMFILSLLILRRFHGIHAEEDNDNHCQKRYFDVEIYENESFLQNVIYGLSQGRCGVARVQICPEQLSYFNKNPEHFDSEYEKWGTNTNANSTSKIFLDYKIRRSAYEIRTKNEKNTKNNTTINLPSDILALFDLFHEVSKIYNIL